MKELISLKEVEAALKRGEKILEVSSNALITAAATDAAHEAGLTLKRLGAQSSSSLCAQTLISQAFQEKKNDTHKELSPMQGALDSELIYKAVKVLADKGLLDCMDDLLITDCPSGTCTCSKH